MPKNTTVEHYVAEAEKRVDAIAALLSIANGQVAAERRQLQAIRQAITSPVPGREDSGPLSAGDISAAMLA
jgi:hypothetical protein